MDLQERTLEKIGALIVRINKNGELEYVNAAIGRLLGYDPEAIKGRNWERILFGGSERPELIHDLIERVLRDEREVKELNYQQELRTRQGETVWIAWNLMREDDERVIAIGQDITREKTVERQLEAQKRTIEKQKEEVMAGIAYAQNMQRAILPSIDELEARSPGSFIFYQPKDLVSGDLYFFHRTAEHLFVAAIDCTGHGVPGAMISALANTILKDMIVRQRMTDPGDILEATDRELFFALNKKSSRTLRDGMDMALTRFDLHERSIRFAGAVRPLIRVREGVVENFSGDRHPIGQASVRKKEFRTQTIEQAPGDAFYMFSDGYTDQFGGEKVKKFNQKRFKKLLSAIHGMPAQRQKAELQNSFENWRGDQEQIDDVLVIGVQT
jgi:PAS domain S-box-containing protein